MSIIGMSESLPAEKRPTKPLQLLMVEPPESDEQFVGLDDDQDPPVKLVFDRPLTTYETGAVVERYPDAKVSKVSKNGDSAGTDYGVVTVTIPYATFSNPARLADDLNAVLSAARKLAAHNRARLSAWQEAAAVINNALM